MEVPAVQLVGCFLPEGGGGVLCVRVCVSVCVCLSPAKKFAKALIAGNLMKLHIIYDRK